MQISKYLARCVFFIIIIKNNIIGMYPVRETHIFEEELKRLFWVHRMFIPGDELNVYVWIWGPDGVWQKSTIYAHR